MSRTIRVAILLMLFAAFGLFLNYWTQTQPVWIDSGRADSGARPGLPLRNLRVIELLEQNGNSLAPGYDEVVCTEFVIKAILPFTALSREDKERIRIITSEDLVPLIENDSPSIKGVQTALTLSNKGGEITNALDVLPGDFVQFWNLYDGKAYGHCGVVSDIDPGQSLTLYSSHPLTRGYGKQVFLWPDKVYFVRLK